MMTSSHNNVIESIQDNNNDKIEKMLNNESLTTSTIIDDVKTLLSSNTPQVSSTNVGKTDIIAPSDKKERVAKYLNDTILPSKSPLNQSDPFSHIMSKDYLLYFTFGASVALFVLKLFS